MSDTVYGLVDNGASALVKVEFDVQWDETNYISVTVTTDDDDESEIVTVIVDADKADEFFAAVAATKFRWGARTK